jgi:hypothetical protein
VLQACEVPATYTGIIWIIYALFMQFLASLDRKMAAKNQKILLFPDKQEPWPLGGIPDVPESILRNLWEL